MSGIDDLSHRIGSIETKVDDMRSDFKAFLVEYKKHEDRIREVEGFKSYLMGMAAVASIAFSLVIDFVKSRIFGAS